MGSNGKNWLLNPESSSQSEGHSSKWLIWLVVREPLYSLSKHLLFNVWRETFEGENYRGFRRLRDICEIWGCAAPTYDLV